jgi:hypothetical protein
MKRTVIYSRNGLPAKIVTVEMMQLPGMRFAIDWDVILDVDKGDVITEHSLILN